MLLHYIRCGEGAWHVS